MAFRLTALIPVFLMASLAATVGCTRVAKPVEDPNKTPQQLEPTGGPVPEPLAKSGSTPRPVPVVPKSDPKPLSNPKDKPPESKSEPVNPPKTDTKVPTPDPKGGKDPKDTKEPKAEPMEPAFVEPTEVLGKTYEQWKTQVRAADPTRREEAMKTILFFGPAKAYDALPVIIGELKKHKPPVARVDLSVCVNGLFAITQILLSKKEPDPEHVDEAFKIYKSFMKDEQVILRTRAVQGVLALGPKAHDAIEDVMKVARDGATWEVRREGLLVLGQLARDMKTMNTKVPAELRKALNDSAVPVRMVGLQTILAVKDKLDAKELKTTVDAIETRAKKEENPVLQIFAYNTIMTLTDDVKKVHLDPIIKMLQHKETPVRVQALQAIKTLGPKGQPAMDDVSKLARNGDTWQLRKEALFTVVTIGFDKKDLHQKVFAELTHALDDVAPELRLYALQAIVAARGALDKKEKDNTVKSLEISVRREKEAAVKIWMYATIMTLTEVVSKPRLDPVIQMLDHKESIVRLQALQVIGLCGKDAKDIALSAVLNAVKDPDVSIATAAIDALPNLHAFETIPMLKSIMEDKKTPPELIEAAEDAIAMLQEGIAQEKSRKDKSKKGTEKKDSPR